MEEAHNDNGGYQFTNNWFGSVARNVWDQLIPQLNPTRILEVGSYEGASACYIIDKLAATRPIELHCVDPWTGGAEHEDAGHMRAVEHRFHQNTSTALARARGRAQLTVHKSRSDDALVKLLAQGKQGYFDFVYIDGSHQAPDVLCDAVLGFRLLRKNGLLAFDDYLWQEPLPYGTDLVRCPKPAIDAFTNLYCRKLRIVTAPLYQLFVQKLAD